MEHLNMGGTAKNKNDLYFLSIMCKYNLEVEDRTT